MVTLNSSYQYIGRSNGVGCKAGYNYYILVYAKTSGDISSGKHTVTVLQRLACEVNSTFYGWFTSGSVTANNVSIASWSWMPKPGVAWNESPITEGGVTYKQWVNLNEGSVVIDVGYGVTKDINISSSWVMQSSDSSATYLPYAGNPATTSNTVTLPMIATASAITSASDVTLGDKCVVKWTPMAAAFYYKMGFQLGSWKYSTEVVHPNQTSEYTYTGLTIPLEVANQLPNDSVGTMYVYLHTFTDSAGKNQIGNTSSATFKVTVPNNAATKPTVSMELTAVHSLPSQFSGLYIQGKSKVKVNPSAKGKYGASITSYSVNVGGASYGAADEYTSGYLSTYGSINVTCYATDSRGYTGDTPLEISVIAYRDPTLENVSAVRCDKNGNESESGTYLKIKAKRSYIPVISNGQQKNFCQIRYRYKVEGNSYYAAEWKTILAADDLGSDEVVTEPLLNGNFLATTSYRVEVQALDDIGYPALSTIIVPTDKVYWHRDGARNALGLGKYNEKDNALDSAWDIHMNGHRVTGLPTPTSNTDAIPLGFLQDYVVEQGTSGIWTYCKWNSGRAELWGYGRATRENGYVLAKELDYPFTLTSAYCGIGTLNSYGGNAGGALPWNLKLAYGPTTCKIWIHDQGGSFTADSSLEASVYIVGRWK